MTAITVQTGESLRRRQLRRLIWIIGLALAYNAVGWIVTLLWPNIARAVVNNGVWSAVSLLGAFLTGAVIGRPWALLVTAAFVVIHAIPVYLKLLPGYLSTWEEALWWAFALTLLLALTGLGLITRRTIHWVRSQVARPISSND